MNPQTPIDEVENKERGTERERLAESERRAARPHPDNYKEAETDQKVVEVGPDMTDAPIEGIDADEERR